MNIRIFSCRINIFKKKPHQHVVDFIDSVSTSNEILSWLITLQHESKNNRLIRLAKIKNQMILNSEPDEFIAIIDFLENKEVLNAIVTIIESSINYGVKPNTYIKKQGRSQFSYLVSIMYS